MLLQGTSITSKSLRLITLAQTTSENANDSDQAPEGSLKEKYGLFCLVPLTERPEGCKDEDWFDVDIIAIHGLNGGAYSTWEHEDKTLWLKDLLPERLPGARVFTYGYPSEFFFKKSVATLEDYSLRLLSCIRDDRYEDVGSPALVYK